jgi:hypothetical protein
MRTTGMLGRIGETAVSTGCASQELATDPSSTFRFVSCSGSGADSIAQFAISPATGVLTAVQPLFWTGSRHDAPGIMADPSGMFLYSALNTADHATAASIGTSGMLTPSGTPANTGRMPIGLALSVGP